MNISQNEQERAIFRSRRKFQSDMESDLATAWDNGEANGEKKKALAMARIMIAEGEPIDKIARYTGLPIEEVENEI